MFFDDLHFRAEALTPTPDDVTHSVGFSGETLAGVSLKTDDFLAIIGLLA